MIRRAQLSALSLLRQCSAALVRCDDSK